MHRAQHVLDISLQQGLVRIDPELKHRDLLNEIMPLI